MLEYLVLCQQLMKQDKQIGMKHVNANVDQMQVFVIINKGEMKINADVNANNSLIKELVIKDLFGILVNVNVNVINLAMLVSIQITNIASVTKNQLINQLKNVLKMLKK